MRTLISTSLIVIFIIIGSILIYNALDTESDKYCSRLESIEKYAYKENWDNADAVFQDMNSQWEKSKNKWSMAVDHVEIDSITIYLAELDAFIHTKSKAEVLSRLSILKELFNHIPDKEKLQLKNVL